ncbi:MAG: hypothetical protein QM820_46970 [Minicystis sp.]
MSVKPGERCAAVVLDEERRAKLCLKPATQEREIEGIDFALCGFHSREWDETASKTGKWSGTPAPEAGVSREPPQKKQPLSRHISTRFEPAIYERLVRLAERHAARFPGADVKLTTAVRAAVAFGIEAAERDQAEWEERYAPKARRAKRARRHPKK